MLHKAMRHSAIPLAFSYLWTLIRGRVAPQPAALSQEFCRETSGHRARARPAAAAVIAVLNFCLSMIFFENRFPLFGIMLCEGNHERFPPLVHLSPPAQ